MDNKEKEMAIKQYNWKGQIVAYQQQNSWIPAGVDSYMSREIEERIRRGVCILLEPEISLVYNVYGENGKWRGYLWNDIFVPNDENNPLFQLIKSRILDAICQVAQAPKAQLFDGKKVTEFTVGIYFDSQWLSIKDEISAIVDYSFGDPHANSYNVRFKNLYCHRSLSIEEIIKNERRISFSTLPFDEGVPRGSILEISLPIENIGKVFKLYRHKIHSINFDISYLDDRLDMHLAQTGRSSSRGPTIDWLIIHLWEYLDDFILDIGNRALDFISYSGHTFEDQNMKHISKRMIHSRNYILRKYVDNTYEPHKMSFFRDHRFYHADEKRTILNKEKHENIVNEADPVQAFRTKFRELPLKKVRTMIEVGLTLEALCLLNGYLEVTFKIALRLAFPDDRMRSEISSLTHRDVLRLLKSINILSNMNSYSVEAGEKYRNAAEKIYSHRNDYLHALELPEASIFMTNSTRLTLEALMAPFIQPHESDQFLIYIDGYRTNYQIQELVCNEIAKRAKNKKT